MDIFSLKGKIAWVTGGGRGIGFGLTAGLARAGATVVFNARSERSVNQALKELRGQGIEARGFVCDVTNEQAVQGLVREVERTLGPIDVLVNNAGITNRVPMVEMSVEDFREVIDINLIAPFLCAKAVLPAMMKRRTGKIINIGSLMCELGRETVSAYASAKGGLKMLTRNIASEHGQYNIQCNGIGPGYIATELTAPLREPQPDGSQHPFDKFLMSRTPAARWGTPEDLVGALVFLASGASDFVNGHMLYVDGGILATIGKQP